ncbi:MAG: JAB domain-containing protein, partial [Sphaerochaetaceae bacterium]
MTEGLEVELASLAEDEEIETPKALGERYALRLENRNYDGLILADDELGGTSFVALYPNQIKSATGNSGEFSADNDSILYQTQDKNDALISELNSLGSAKLASERLSELGYNIPDSEMHYEDGKLFIVDDPGLVMETVRKNLKEVSSQLDLFDASAANGAVHYTYFDQSSQDKKRGVLPPDYSYDNGWSGKEPLPQTIKGKWDSFGFVSFIGAKISSSDDVARMFSIYRNPKIEYFHIVTVKDGKINGQYALSSGLANMTIGMLGTAEATIKTIGEDYDKVYLIHNHPSGNITPSNCDIDVTAQYIKNLGSKFDGHIILDHTDYTVLTHSQGSDYISSESVQAKGFHQVASRKVLSDTLRDPNDVANAYLSNSTKENRTVIMLLDGQHRLIEMDDIDISKLNSQYLIDLFKNKQYTAGFVVSDSLNDYDKLKVKVHENNQLPLLDILLVSKDGTINSMVYSGELKSFKWADKYLKGKKKDSFDWSKTSQDETLFQTEDEYQQMVNDAKDFSSPKEFSDFYKTMYDENTDPNLIIKAYDEAHPAPGKPDSGFTASMTDSEKDEELVRQINTDEGLDKFINAIRNLSNFDYQYVQGYLRDMGEDDQIEHEVYQRFEKEASPFIVAIAKGKDKLSDKARKSIRSMIANNARMYRDLYAAILHDDTLKASQYDQFLPDIDEPANEVARLSIMDRKRLSMKIEAEGLKKKILSGEELLEGETEKVIRQLDSDIDSLNERIADLQKRQEQLKAKEKALKKKQSVEERKKRIRRLIELGGIIESVLERPTTEGDKIRLLYFLKK